MTLIFFFLCFSIFFFFQLLPQYEEAHKRAVFKAAAIVRETKNVLNALDAKGLTDLRGMHKPDSEIEDLLAAIIIIGMLKLFIQILDF